MMIIPNIILGMGTLVEWRQCLGDINSLPGCIIHKQLKNDIFGFKQPAVKQLKLVTHETVQLRSHQKQIRCPNNLLFRWIEFTHYSGELGDAGCVWFDDYSYRFNLNIWANNTY